MPNKESNITWYNNVLFIIFQNIVLQ